MAVPDFQTIMRPLLVALEDGEDQSIKQIRERLAEHFSLTPEDLAEKIPSGRAKTFQNRVGWATTYLYRTGLVERPKRSTYRITARGKEVLVANPQLVNLRVLAQFKEFNEFRLARSGDTKEPIGDGGGKGDDPEVVTQTPEEQIDAAYRELRAALAADLLDRVRDHSPEFFEQLVLDVLHAMGYGGKHDGAAQRLGQSGDEGVDGVIREDELGLDLIYVQAKRWANTVTRPEIQKFFGALHGKRASKGVFITTSQFSDGAKEYAEGVTPRVILLDGKELARLMMDYDVGVSDVKAYRLKRVDLDYFVADDGDEPSTQPAPPSAPDA